MSGFILSGFGDEIDSQLEVQLKVMSDLGMNHIELRGVNGKCIVDYSIEEAEEIKKVLDSFGFTASAIASPIGKIGITDNFEEHFELFKHSCDIAHAMGTRKLRIFSFYIPNGEYEKYRGEVIHRLEAMLLWAEEHDITLCHENECGIYGDNAERCLDIMQTFGGRMRCTFDPQNFINNGTEPYPYAFDMLKSYIDYLHMKDMHSENRMVMPCGYGDGRIPEMLQELKDSGYHGILSVEPHLNVFDGRENLEQNPHLQNSYPSQKAAFTAAVNALKDLIADLK